MGGWLGGCIVAHSNRLFVLYPPTHLCITVARSNRLFLLYLSIHTTELHHSTTHPPTYLCDDVGRVLIRGEHGDSQVLDLTHLLQVELGYCSQNLLGLGGWVGAWLR